MALYTGEAPSVDGLKSTYNNAAKQQNSRCGSTFAVVASSLPDSSDTSGAFRVHLDLNTALVSIVVLGAALRWL